MNSRGPSLKNILNFHFFYISISPKNFYLIHLIFNNNIRYLSIVCTSSATQKIMENSEN